MIATNKVAHWPDSMNVTVDIDTGQFSNGPKPEQFTQWVHRAIDLGTPAHMSLVSPGVSIRLVDETESAALNSQYREKQGATNVLSFPAHIPEPLQALMDPIPLGDLAICAAVVEREAALQQKAVLAHWAHMTVHGTLHLLGHDHQHDSEAEAMEQLEATILASLGFADNPYDNDNPDLNSDQNQGQNAHPH